MSYNVALVSNIGRNDPNMWSVHKILVAERSRI